MKKHLIIEKIPLYSDAWYAYRLNYINGSEQGGLMGLSQYTCASRIFNEKIGVMDQWKEGNKHTHWGSVMEATVGDIWQYQNPTGPEDNYVSNYKAGNIQRKCKSIFGYIRNPKYPWLSVSLDRVINKNQSKMNGEVLSEESPLEIKTIDAYEMSKWTSVPPTYLAQVHTQMIVTETDYSEMVLFDSRKNLNLFPVEYNKEFGQQIIDMTHDFWYNKVVPAKELIIRLNASNDIDERSDLQHQINQLEPPPEATPAYEDFIKDKYKDSYVKDSKEGSMEDWENAVKYLQVNDEYKLLDAKQLLYKNNILKSLAEHEFISFGEDGEISYSPSKKGVRSLRIKLKN